jgi:hypothetical protein
MRYELPIEDQCDWNKLHGVSWEILNNHEDALMVAWRWCRGGFFELAPYIHDDGVTIWAGGYCNPNANELPVAKVLPGDVFTTRLILAQEGWATVEIRTPGGSVTYRHFYGVEPDNRYREIGPWFGGNREAPHAMCLQRQRLN